MGKINSLYTTGKTYLKRFFNYVGKSAEKSVSIEAETIKEPQKITSEQIKAYYKKYGKALEKKPETETASRINRTEQNSRDVELKNSLRTEIEAYNTRRFFEVSKEALASIEHNFESKKQKVTEIILANSEILPSEYIKAVKKIKNSDELIHAIRSFSGTVTNNIIKQYPEMFNKLIKEKKISLNDQKLMNKINTKAGKAYVNIIKAVTEPSKDSRVIQIENYIKKMYDMDYVHLESFEEAKNILAAIKIALRNNLPLPKNIIVSPYQPYMAGGVNIGTGKSRSIIFLSSAERKNNTEEAYQKLVSPRAKEVAQQLRKSDEIYSSTKHPLHNYIHEICHCDQPFIDIFPVRVRKLPEKYQKTAQQVSEYAKQTIMELEAELRTKKILASLSEEEEALLKFLN